MKKRLKIKLVVGVLFYMVSLQSIAGREIYEQNCASCHDIGLVGAPRLGDSEVWRALIAKGITQLNRHSIEGYSGQNGYMPPRGGNPGLSDEQVKQAVRFMVDQVW